MGRFSEDWLSLREPADHAAINSQVRRRLRQHFAQQTAIRVIDLGCGTGSNLRNLAPDLPAGQSWIMIDHDRQILHIAKQRADEFASLATNVAVETRVVDLSQDDIADMIKDADLVTAAAFFDLTSAAFIENLANQIAAAGCVFSTALTYDGIAAWLPQHHLDPVMRDAFNTHQCSDKGFGAAAGPDATDVLAGAFKRHGYSVIRGASPWMLTSRFAELRWQTDAGWAAAVAETGRVSQHDLKAWLDSRQTQNATVTIVGHEDLLALPPSPFYSS